MYITQEKLQHINTITHEGKVVILATDAQGKIWYSVKQDGFEDSYLNTPPEQRTGWENWQELELPFKRWVKAPTLFSWEMKPSEPSR
ncbi:MAG: hypothetical protein RLO19_10495 [Coleofasciculus sp. G2-EDA-02]